MVLSSKSFRTAALGAAAILVLTACSGAAAPSAATTAPTSAPITGAPSQAVTAAPGALPVPEKSEISIGLGLTEMSAYAGVLAEQLGIYKKYGLNVSHTVFDGEGRAVSTLQAGQIDIVFSGMANAISSQLTDAPYDIFGALAVTLTDDLVCQKGIDTADEVKGKKIAISTFGGVSNASALIALKSLKLAANDAIITQVGGQSARLAALQGGSIDCAIIDSNIEDDMIKQGFGIAAQLKKADIEFGRSGMGATKEWLAANPNTALVALASVLEAQNVIFSDPQSVIAHYAEFAQLDEAAAAKQVNDFVAVGNRSLMWTDQAFINPQKAIAVVNPDIIDVNVADAFDRSFLEKLAESGFYEKIGSPRP